MLWIKAFHIFFVIGWSVGLLYLPRIFVNIALENETVVRKRLLIMARRLYRFMTFLFIFAVAAGMWLFMHRMGMRPGFHWMKIKLFCVFLLMGYHHACARMLRKFDMGKNTRSATWFRWFNEVPAVLLGVIVVLVVVKPW